MATSLLSASGLLLTWFRLVLPFGPALSFVINRKPCVRVVAAFYAWLEN